MTNQSQIAFDQNAFTGGKHAQASLILAILGVVFLPLAFIFSPLAISQARKAEQRGVPATVGKVIGWIGALLWLAGLFATGITALFVLPNL